MSEIKLAKPVRTVEDIRAEYTKHCNKAGHCSYQIEVLTRDLNLLYTQMSDLNLEAAAASNKKEENSNA